MESRFDDRPASRRPSASAPPVLEIGWDNGAVIYPVGVETGISEIYVQKRFHSEAVDAIRALLRVMGRPEEGGEAALARRKAETVLFREEAYRLGSRPDGLPVNWRC